MKTMDAYCFDKPIATNRLVSFVRSTVCTFVQVFILLSAFFLLTSNEANSQLGVYSFAGSGSCPTQNPGVTTSPSNSIFSNFTTVNADCRNIDDKCVYRTWNRNISIDLTEYHQFSITANPTWVLNLTSLSFTHSTDENGPGGGTGSTNWALRSSLDNYTTDIATGSAHTGSQTPVITLPSQFLNLTGVTFRLYLMRARTDNTEWTIDDVSISGLELAAPADPGNPTSNSPQCSNPGVTLTMPGSPPAGETWYWQIAANGTNTTNSSATWVVNTAGTYYLRSRDNATGAWSIGAGSVTVSITPDVTTPVFTMGASSTRCMGAGNVTYTATATNTTGITYSLDAASLAAGNTINSSTGEVTYIAGYTGTSTITASAAGCGGPLTASH
ncbi:MAG TPA: hypothetical protein VEB42_16800, partial [Chitinophagaceae bacterium]|nr:hypothetical protein [Chitinophagaceae bacterium]